MKLRTAFLLTSGVSLLCVLVTLVPYMAFLGTLKMATTDPEPWAHFGTYFGGVLGPLLAFVNLLALVYIAVQLTQAQQTELATKRLTLDLYNDWHSDHLHESRIIVSGLIEAHRIAGTPMPTMSEFEKMNCTDTKHAFRVYHFFEKWALLTRERQTDTVLLIGMLGSYGDWWRKSFFGVITPREVDTHMARTLNLIETQVFSRIAKSR